VENPDERFNHVVVVQSAVSPRGVRAEPNLELADGFGFVRTDSPSLMLSIYTDTISLKSFFGFALTFLGGGGDELGFIREFICVSVRSPTTYIDTIN
jgi:hypothetical protein